MKTFDVGHHEEYVRKLEEFLETAKGLIPAHQSFISEDRSTSAYIRHLRPLLNAIEGHISDIAEHVQPKEPVQKDQEGPQSQSQSDSSFKSDSPVRQ